METKSTQNFCLKSFRRRNHLKQSELAAFLGVNQSFVSEIERGKSQLPRRILDKIQNNPAWTISEDDYLPSGDATEIAILRREVEILKRRVEQLEEQKKLIIEAITRKP